ncbi:P-loop containing nucleoside triphosphate hydrolase protein [Boletus edulis]|nr:P-loop containing nucleoside triphosphate hydrolase protein [Boletus edulis]
MSKSNQRTLHVAIVGNTGVGKSTLVNVLKGDEIAEVNNDVKPCTTRKKEYEVVDGNTTYHIWDTRGLNEASEKEVLPIRILKFARILPDADRELKRFLRGKEPSVDLVLLCIDAKKTKVEVHWKIFDKVYVDFCEEGLKVAVVVTRLKEKDFSGPGSEWKGTCKGTAKKVVKEFPDMSLIEAVPEFGELSDKSVNECRGRILTLISKACSR